jgi:uncharacterized protein YqjF (DUF2071 family)
VPLARADVRDVWFAHWPLGSDELASRLPAALDPATRDGSAWASVLVQRTLAGVRGVPLRFPYRQVAVRTYVTPADAPADAHDDRVGVFFLWLGADSRLASVGGRLVYNLPFHRVDVAVDQRPASADVRVGLGTDPVFAAKYESIGDPTAVDPSSLAGWLTERYRYYRPDGRAGRVSHPPWALARVAGTVEATGLFAAADVPMPDTAPVCHYSPGTPITLRSRP